MFKVLFKVLLYKKTFLILLFIVFYVVISGCSINNVEKLKNNPIVVYKNEVTAEIIRCIKEKDKVCLNDLFCERVKDTQYLNRQIDAFFNYIDKQGDMIIDDNGKWKDYGHHSRRRSGKRVIDFYSWKYNKEISIGNKKYILYCGVYATFLNHNEYEGINEISLIEQISDKFKNNENKDDIIFSGGEQERSLGIELLNYNYNISNHENIISKSVPIEKMYSYTFDELEDSGVN